MPTNEEITIVKAQPEHDDQVLRLLKESFMTREPLVVSLGVDWNYDMKHFQKDMVALLHQGYSFVALNPAGRVVGCRISTIQKMERNQDPEPDYMHIGGDTPKIEILKNLFRSLTQGWTKELPDCNTIFEFVVMCVEEQYGGCGIAQKLVDKSLQLAEELQADYVSTTATNWRSQRVFDKLGFFTVKMKNFDEFIDENGKHLLNMNDGTTCMKWMAKKMKK